ncbi:MAG: T9SS type A sorting domain-containing protein [Bacteroidales bacterium]|nr:T9SS type A sorting domain-containing protein [Bacteroidales bacterium]
MKFSFFSVIVIIISVIQLKSQTNENIYWKDHLSYNIVLKIIEVNNIIYGASPSGLVKYNKTDNSISKISKINGLSDIDISAIELHEESNSIVIGYASGNLDLIVNNTILNFPHLYQKTMQAPKTINDIAIYKQWAYLATDFGIAVFDVKRQEFYETYFMGTNGESIKINSIAFDTINQYIFAASEKAVHYAKTSSGSLLDYRNWKTIPSLPENSYNNLCFFDNKLYFVKEKNTDTLIDSLYTFNYSETNTFYRQFTDIKSISVSQEKFIIVDNNDIYVYDKQLLLKNHIKEETYNVAHFNDVLIDNSNVMWICNSQDGIIKAEDKGTTICPNGPLTNTVTKIAYRNGDIMGAFGKKHHYKYARIGIYGRGTWYNRTFWDIWDAICITAKEGESDFYVGTHLFGLVKSNLFDPYTVYNKQNGLFPNVYKEKDSTRTTITSVDFDSKGNLWMTNWAANVALTILTPEMKFHSIALSSVYATNDQKDLFIDSDDRKWVCNPENKYAPVYVFDENGTLENDDDDFYASIQLRDEENTFATSAQAIVEDLEGDIWIGTNQGIGLYRDASDIFEDDNPILTRIKIEVNGKVDYLLNGEYINCLAVDGGNRKWVGTQNSGVFLISEDGKTQLKHFNFENSPLVSNSVYSIAIDAINGDVFFATEKGIVSYKSDAVKEFDNLDGITIYPNPVRETYHELIYINGLKPDTRVKITDIAGGIVYETISQGGMATWNGNNFNGNRVATGVYLIMFSDDLGEETKVKKILFIN